MARRAVVHCAGRGAGSAKDVDVMAKKQAKQAQPQTWRNRIVGGGEQPASQFMANPSNARIHPKQQQQALIGSLNEIGWIQNVIVNKTTGNVVDGHARIAEALKMGDETPVPYVEVELTEDEEKLALATLDPISAMAAYDKAQLDALLREVNTGDAALQTMLAELAQDNGLDYGGSGGPAVEDVEPQIDKAAELQKKWNTARGQLWQLGAHRLLCGDSTSAEDVARVTDGKKVDMMFTDPPYGVDYTGGHFHSGDVNIKRERERLSGDTTTRLYDTFLPVWLCVVDGPCYMWFAGSKAYDVYKAIKANGCEVHALIIWNKINATYAAMNAQYKQRHEPCLYFKPKGATLRWCGPTNECTVWDIKRDGQNEFHPTQKPIELAARAIKNHDAATVADAFSGSGSTLMACEQLGRKCRAVEISPEYVAVALERWSTATGKTPELMQ